MLCLSSVPVALAQAPQAPLPVVRSVEPAPPVEETLTPKVENPAALTPQPDAPAVRVIAPPVLPPPAVLPPLPVTPEPPVAAPLPQPAGPLPPVYYPPPVYAPVPRQIRLLPPRLTPIQPPRRHGDAGGPWALGMAVDVSWRDDPGYHYVTRHRASGEFELFASHDVLEIGRPLVVSAGLSYRHFGSKAQSDLSLDQHALQGDLVARVTAASWLFPHVRASFGVVTSKLELDSDQHDISLTVHDTNWLATFGGGATLRTPARLFESRRGKLASLSFGIILEGGYVLAPAADFHQRGSHGEGIARAPLSLGLLDRKAPYLRIGMVTRF
jgi:hypothetical protein